MLGGDAIPDPLPPEGWAGRARNRGRGGFFPQGPKARRLHRPLKGLLSTARSPLPLRPRAQRDVRKTQSVLVN
jgi:hypothetical protein